MVSRGHRCGQYLAAGIPGRDHVGIYREGDLLLPIIMRAEEQQRSDIARNIQDLTNLESARVLKMIPLRQVVCRF